MGKIFNIERFALYDGYGVRTVVFLKGCPLRCVWCHNPEGLLKSTQIMYNESRCIGCGACVHACENSCHLINNKIHTFNRNNCNNCGKCANVCYPLALTAVGNEVTASEIINEVLKDKAVYLSSGGGLTLSGGEPLMQGEFSAEILKLAKEKGIHTIVETSGFGDSEVLKEIANFTDVFLFDYKVSGSENYLKYCGVKEQPILNNLNLLKKLKKEVVFRLPIIPNVNDTKEHIEGIKKVVLSNNVFKIEIMPYHSLGISKCYQLGIEPSFKQEVFDSDKVNEFANNLRKSLGEDFSIKVN